MKGTAGWQKELYRKIDRNGISVRLYYAGGISLGFAKPIYYKVFTTSGIGEILYEENLKFTKLFEKATLMKYDYTKALTACKDQGRQFDVIYMDPPFDKGYQDHALSLIMDNGLLAEGGIIVCESDRHTEIDFGDRPYEVYKEKVFKTCKFTFIR